MPVLWGRVKGGCQGATLNACRLSAQPPSAAPRRTAIAVAILRAPTLFHSHQRWGHAPVAAHFRLILPPAAGGASTPASPRDSGRARRTRSTTARLHWCVTNRARGSPVRA